jgi:hypothetical protein
MRVNSGITNCGSREVKDPEGVVRGLSVRLTRQRTPGGPGEPPDPHQHPYFRPPTLRRPTAKLTALAAQITDPVPCPPQTFADVPTSQSFWHKHNFPYHEIAFVLKRNQRVEKPPPTCHGQDFAVG